MNTTSLVIFLVVFLIITVAIMITFIVVRFIKIKNIKEKVNNRLNDREEFTPEQFFEMYNDIKKYKLGISNMDKSGCYVLLNKTKNMNYVGQSKRVIFRINQHLTGKGNGDVYADYKYGSKFIIFIVECNENELNIIEKNLIKQFNAYNYGYNRNSGVGSYY